MRNIHGWHGLLLHAARPCVTDNTHDFTRPFLGNEIESNALVQRIFIGKETANERLIHDDDKSTGSRVLRIEIASASNRNFHRAEVIGRHCKVAGRLSSIRSVLAARWWRRSRPAFNQE